ncbi:PspA/IM30 family protein [Nocardia sp. IFM 10818]
MSDANKELAVLLAQLPDAELAAVVEQATDGRAGLAALHAVAASVAATVGHAPQAIDVTPDTQLTAAHPVSDTPGVFGQVGGGPAVSGTVVPPAGIPVTGEMGGYSESGVPTFESVRDKVEQRYGTARGMGELDRQTPVGRSVEEQWDAREKAARERLEKIRKSVHGNDNE